MRRVTFNWVPVSLVCLIAGLVVVAFSFREIAISFHRWAMVSDWNAAHKPGPTDSRQSNYIKSFENHRDALTALGYFKRSVFPVRHIEPGTAEWKRLYLALNDAVTNVADGFFVMSGYEEQARHEIIAWARPEQQKRFEAIISRFDVKTGESITP